MLLTWVDYGERTGPPPPKFALGWQKEAKQFILIALKVPSAHPDGIIQWAIEYIGLELRRKQCCN